MAKFTVDIELNGSPVSVDVDADNEKQAAEFVSKYAASAEGVKELSQMADKPKGFIERNASTISAMARPTLEIGGAIGGAALAGATAAPSVVGALPAAAAGGALGLAAGKSGADYLDRKLGLMAPIESAGQALGEIGGNIVEGVKSEAMGAGIGKIARLAKPIGKGLISATLGPSTKAVGERFARNEAIKQAKPFDVLARQLPEDIQVLADSVGKQSDEALSTLSTSKYLDDGAKAKTDIVSLIKSEKDALGRSVSDATSQAKKTLDRYAFRLRRLNNTVSESELGKIIRDIDNDIDWSAKEALPLNNALESVRTKIDGILKTGNLEYAAAMEPVANGVRLLKKAQQIFHVENDIGRGFKATNNTATAIKSALKETRVDSQDVLDAIKNTTGRDYLAAGNEAAIAEQFIGGRTQGSRRVNMGGTVGAGVGSLLGAVLGGGSPSAGMAGAGAGALAGGYVDQEGGRLAGSLIDQLVRLSKYTRKVPSEHLQRAIGAAATYPTR